MEFAVELLSKLLVRRKIAVSSPGLALTAQDLLESASYQALCRIRGILQDDTLSDLSVFKKLRPLSRCSKISVPAADPDTISDSCTFLPVSSGHFPRPRL